MSQCNRRIICCTNSPDKIRLGRNNCLGGKRSSSDRISHRRSGRPHSNTGSCGGSRLSQCSHRDGGKKKKSMALIDMGNVKEERVAIHQVFLLRDTFPIIQSGVLGAWGWERVKDSDAQKHLRRKCSEFNYGGGGRRRKQRNASRNKTDFPQGSPSLPPYKPLFVPERGASKKNKLINKVWLLSGASDIPSAVGSSWRNQ